MLDDFVKIIKGLLVSPVETFESLKSTTLSRTYQYYVLLLIMYTVLMSIVSLLSSLMTYYDMVIQCASIPIFGSFLLTKLELLRPIFLNMSLFAVYLLFLFLFFGIFLKAFFLHTFVLLFEGKQGIMKTVQVLMYSVTPFFLLGWIPYISIIALLWAVILCILGFHILQQIPIWKAALIIIIPTLFVTFGVLIVYIIYEAFITASSGII